MLLKIDPSGSLTVEDTPSLNEEQVAAYKEAAASSISLGYTVAFPIGVLVIVVMETLLPKVFRIDMEKEREKYQKELEENMAGEKKMKPQPLNFMILSFVAIIGIAVGSITIPLGGFGSFSLGAAGGVLLAALILSYVGQIGPVNFRMEDKSLGIMYQMGLTFFMAVVGLRYGYDVVMSLMGSGLSLAIAAIFVEAAAVLVSFLIGHYIFKLNWIILSVPLQAAVLPRPDWEQPSVLPVLRNQQPDMARHSHLRSLQMYCLQLCFSISFVGYLVQWGMDTLRKLRGKERWESYGRFLDGTQIQFLLLSAGTSL